MPNALIRASKGQSVLDNIVQVYTKMRAIKTLLGSKRALNQWATSNAHLYSVSQPSKKKNKDATTTLGLRWYEK